MRIKIDNSLILVNLLIILLIAAINFSLSIVLRILLGLPFLLFIPGHVLMLAVNSKKDGITGIQRILFSCGLSIVIVSLIGLILSYTKWGITVETSLYSITFFIVVLSVIAWFRQSRLPNQERLVFEFRLKLLVLGQGFWRKTLTIVLIVSIVGALGMLGYTMSKPLVGERFTEFYILSLDRSVEGLPTTLAVGDGGNVIVSIVNNEGEEASYRLEIRVDGEIKSVIEQIILDNKQKIEFTVGFTVDKAGASQKVEFLLYKQPDNKSYRTLALWVNVK